MNSGGAPQNKASGGESSGASGLFDEQGEREDVAAGGETGFREERDVVSNVVSIVSVTAAWSRCNVSGSDSAARTDRRGVTSCLWANPTNLARRVRSPGLAGASG